MADTNNNTGKATSTPGTGKTIATAGPGVVGSFTSGGQTVPVGGTATKGTTGIAKGGTPAAK